MADVHRVNANFSGEAYNLLLELATRRGKSISDILREAVALEKWVYDAKEEGGKILVERNGKIRELVIH